MLDTLTRAITQLLPADVGQELKKNIDAVVRSHFAQMNLVTRDQLDVQEKILRRTRQRIEQLENQVEELEKLTTKQ
jgi:BMFP domain-containing protein YqiC